jgi:asparagine synthase (glutamine-hydrolysing)
MGGGFDTSAICALAGPVVAPQGRKFITASSVMPEDDKATAHRLRHWVEICRRHMPHLDVRYVTREGLDVFSRMEEGFRATEMPHSPNHYVTAALLDTIKAGGARIVMDGFGGDYTINPRFPNALARLLIRGKWLRFFDEYAALKKRLRLDTRRMVIRQVLYPMLPIWLTRARSRLASGRRPFGPTMPLAKALLRAPGRFRLSRRYNPIGDPRKAMLWALRGQQNLPSVGYAVPAASHGLEFTEPFHDKRVVELGLAIPEDLYLKEGKDRWLARAALSDLYPPEFQDRLPGNDGLGPDFLMMATRVEPKVLAEIDRMEQAGKLTPHFDFPQMRKMLTRRSSDGDFGSQIATRQALLAFLRARYIEWFTGHNA